MRLEAVGLDEFRTLREEWNVLVARSGSDTPFLRHEWLCAVAETLAAPGWTPLILRLRDGRQSLGYVPLVRVQSRTRFAIRLSRFHFLGAQLTEFADFVLPAEEQEIVEAALSALQQWHGWVEFVGHYISETSPRVGTYAKLAQRWPGGELAPYEPCWYIRIAGRTWEEYLCEEAGREFVIRGVRRRAAVYEQLDWGVEELRVPSAEIIGDVVRLHAASQRRKGRTSLFASNRRYLDFLERILAESARLGWLRLFALRIEQQTAAFILGFLYGGVFYWWLQGFDPKYERLAPTKVLLWHVLQRAFSEQWQEFNFMGGDTEYKRHWAKRWRQFYRLRLPRWRGLARWLNLWRFRHRW
ncbi:MAG: GNAT family N-acetyltransferase [Chlorobiota bacterium]